MAVFEQAFGEEQWTSKDENKDIGLGRRRAKRTTWLPYMGGQRSKETSMSEGKKKLGREVSCALETEDL